jgi:hypothetical protein
MKAILRSVTPLLVAMYVFACWPGPARAQIARSWNTTYGNWAVAVNWLPNGVPGPLDGAFIGSSAVAENAQVFLNQDDTVAGVSITDGMTFLTFGNSLTVNGNTTVSGLNQDAMSTFRSRLHVNDGGNAYDYRTVGLTVSDGAIITGDGALQVGGQLLLEESEDGGGLWMSGTVNFTGNSGTVLDNNSSIDPVGGNTITLNQLGSGLIDLDGSGEQGRLRSSITVNGTGLADSFHGEIQFPYLGVTEALTMNLTNGWTLGDGGIIYFVSPDTDQINGSDFTIAGTIISGSSAISEINADAILESTAFVSVGGQLDINGVTTIDGGTVRADRTLGEITHFGDIDFTNTTTINGGTFTIMRGCSIDFNGATTIRGGTFNTFSILPADGDFDFSGPTTYSGNMTINGIAGQHGNATVTGATMISGDAFDMDGSVGNTTWDINNSLEVNVERIDAGSSSFYGTFNIGGPAAARLVINLSDPQASWTMAATMNLSGTPFGFANRVAGSPMVVTGQLNVQQRADISANTTLAATSTTDIVASAHLLRMSGVTVVEPGATIMGDGYLQNAASGDMSLPAGLSTGNVGLSNEGVLRLGDAVGVVSVAEFVQGDGATLVVDVGRNTVGTDSDVLTISSSAALVAGFVQPNVVNIGGTFQPPQIGDTFTFLTAVGGVNNTFDDVLDSNLGGQLFEWTLIHNPNNVQVELTDIAGLPGDYNMNGVVDAPDYVIWRKHFGSQTNLVADGDLSGTVDEADYDFWTSRFGNTLGSGSSSVRALPEPSAVWLLMLCSTGAYSSRRWIDRRV